MSCKVFLKDSDLEFFAEQHESLLNAAIRAGLDVDYGCNNGNCGRCSTLLVEGEIKAIHHHDYPQATTSQYREFLMCCYAAASDLVLEECLNDAPIRQQDFSAKVKKIDQIEDVCVVSLRPPRSLRLKFLAGQYALLSGAQFESTECSIASCPCEQDRLELHVSKGQDAFSRYILESCRVGEKINVTAPFGNFVFTKDFNRSAFFFAFETGFAPIKSLIEHITGQEHEIELYLCRITGADKPYLHNLCCSWEDAFDGFVYERMTIKDSDVQELQAGIESTLAKQTGLSEADVYMCVPEAMAHTIRETCLRYGCDSSRLFYEPIRGGAG